ncbi:MAG: toast rack family protein [Dehalococcoidia bacterium]|nr:toast rack family protein [Dehalococcoidia bacterium]
MSRRSRKADSPSPRRGKGGGGKNLPLAGIVLLIAGVILLLQTTGVLPWDMWLGLWRFWPLLVIALGVHILFGRKIGWWATVLVIVAILVAIGGALLLGAGNEKPVSSVTEPLNGLESADVSIKFGAGDLTLTSLPAGSPNLVEGQFGTEGQGARVQLIRSQNKGTLTISPNRQPWIRWFSKASWDLALSQTPKLTMDLAAGAADVKLDLRELKLSELNVNVGATDVEIVMPASAGDVMANINAGAANIIVTIPPGVSAKIKKHTGVSSFAIDAGRFPLSGDVYVSPDFDTAKNRVTIDLEVGAANVTIK